MGRRAKPLRMKSRSPKKLHYKFHPFHSKTRETVIYFRAGNCTWWTCVWFQNSELWTLGIFIKKKFHCIQKEVYHPNKNSCFRTTNQPTNQPMKGGRKEKMKGREKGRLIFCFQTDHSSVSWNSCTKCFYKHTKISINTLVLNLTSYIWGIISLSWSIQLPHYNTH